MDAKQQNAVQVLRAAARFLTERGIASFPLTLEALLQKDIPGVRLVSYEAFCARHPGMTVEALQRWAGPDGNLAVEHRVEWVEGFAFPTPRYLILYREDRPAARRLFTVLHEFGHIACGHGQESGHAPDGGMRLLGEDGGWDRETYQRWEEEANLFARNALCPAVAAAEALKRSGYDLRGKPTGPAWEHPDCPPAEELLAEAFGLSRPAARVRLETLEEDWRIALSALTPEEQEAQRAMLPPPDGAAEALLAEPGASPAFGMPGKGHPAQVRRPGTGPVEIVTFRGPGMIPSLLEELKKPEPPVVLVPQSFTLAAEQAIVRSQPSGGLLGLSILSPRSLIREIRERAGLGEVRPLSAEGRVMLLSRLLLEHEEELQFYRRSVRQSGLAARLAEQLDEFIGAGLVPEDLDRLRCSGATRRKLSDLRLLWEAYEAWGAQGYADEGELWRKALARLGPSGLLRGAHLLLYGFDHITGDLTALIQAAYPHAARITLGLICDEGSPDGAIFLSTHSSIQRFSARTNLPCAFRRFHASVAADPGIRYVESALFAQRQLTEAERAALPDFGAVTLYSARNSARECAAVAQALIRWHGEGLAWADMGVAVCDAETLPALLPQVLRQAGIPCTVRIGQSVMGTELAVFFLSLLRAMSRRYLQADMLNLFRSGFWGLGEDDRMALENYALAHGVNRLKWLRPFPESEETVLRLEEARAKAMAGLTALRERLTDRRCTGRRAAELLYQYLIDQGIYDRLREAENRYLEAGDAERMDLNRQVWTGLMEILDQLAVFAGDRHLALDDLEAMLSAALTSRQIKLLPQDADTVLVSKPSMFLADGLRGMVVAGVQQSAAPEGRGLLSESERRALREQEPGLGMTREELASRARQDVYQAVSLARERLMISTSAARPDGGALYPAQAFKSLAETLAKVRPESVRGGLQAEDLRPFAPGFALQELAVRLREARDFDGGFLGEDSREAEAWRAALRWMTHRREWRAELQSTLAGIHAEVRPTGIGREQAESLYPRSLSPSFAETAGACLCQNWVRSGLRLQERKEFVFQADQRGSFAHEMLRRYFQEAMAEPDWPDLTAERINAILNRILRPETARWREGPLGADTVHRYQGAQIVRGVRTMCHLLTGAMGRTPHFRPWAMEAGFGAFGDRRFPPVRLTTPGGREVTLSGIIDRIDTLTLEDGRRFFLVTDYKSSEKDMRWSDLEAGVSLQLPVYLQAAAQGLRDFAPAGGVFQPLREILVDAGPEEFAEEMQKAARSRGVVLDDPEVQAAMAPLKVARKGGDLIPAVTGEGMEEVMSRAMEATARLIDLQLDGETRPNPRAEGQKLPCEYCLIRHACDRSRS